MKHQIINISLGTLLLFVFWATRIAALDSFPPFIDEAFHVGVAEQVADTGNPVAQASEGRIFTIWWYLLFQPFKTSNAIWLVRVATVLAVLTGLAALFAIGRLAAGLWGGILIGLIYLFSTYHMFFDRLALSDTISNAAVALGVYFAYRLSCRIDEKDALLSGFAIFLAVGAKIGALPYMGIPLAAILTLGPRTYSWKRRARWLTVAAAAQFVPLAILYLVARWGHENIFMHIQRTSPTGGEFFDIDRIRDNVDSMLTVAESYFGLVVLILVIVGILLLSIRKRFYFPLVFLAPTVVILLSIRQSTRYLIAPFTLWLLAGAVTLAVVTRSSNNFRKGLVCVGVLLWGIWFWQPFATAMYQNPIDLALSDAERTEYVESDASGFGLQEVITALESREPDRVIGVISNCATLRYITLHKLPVECPRLNPSGASIPDLEALMASSHDPGTYVVLEDIPYVPTEAPGELLTVIEHETGRPRLSIYDLSAQ